MNVKSSKRVRMWHKNIKGDRCHAWDVDLAAFDLWKQGSVVLQSSKVFLPSGGNPVPGTRVVCGTCGGTNINPTTMEREVVSVG